MAAARVKNLYPGVGVVSDLAGTGYAPVRDGLSSSVHTEVLVEHMRGRVETTLSHSQELPMLALGGTLAIPAQGPALLDLPAGTVELVVTLPQSETLRCYSLGFLASTSAAVQLEATVEGPDEASGTPVRMELPASICAAGVVEVEPSPRHGSSIRLRFDSSAEDITLYDLFVISNG